ncbi:MAG: HAD family hydrolase, partial [Stellaceae bacterium]
TTLEEALEHFTGLTGHDVIRVMEGWIGGPVPRAFHDAMGEASRRALEEGIEPIAGAIEFVRALPPDRAKAVASSSSTRWIRTHLDHLGLRDAFEPHLYSGKEHVTSGKPAPDLYLYAADQLRVDIRRTVILEDSRIGVKGALASGARVIGIAVGKHCLEGHADALFDLGAEHVAHSFDDVRALLAV